MVQRKLLSSWKAIFRGLCESQGVYANSTPQHTSSHIQVLPGWPLFLGVLFLSDPPFGWSIQGSLNWKEAVSMISCHLFLDVETSFRVSRSTTILGVRLVPLPRHVTLQSIGWCWRLQGLDSSGKESVWPFWRQRKNRTRAKQHGQWRNIN